MTPANNQKRIPVLWLPESGKPAEWKTVHAMPVNIRRPGWKNVEVLTYRRAEVVFVVHGPTGINLTYGATPALALKNFYDATAKLTAHDFEEVMKSAFETGHYPPKPVL
jgi:hypothetical protein